MLNSSDDTTEDDSLFECDEEQQLQQASNYPETEFDSERAIIQFLNEIKRSDALPDEEGTSGSNQLLLKLARFNKGITDFTRYDLLRRVLIPSINALWKSMSIAIMVALMALDHPEDAEEVIAYVLRFSTALAIFEGLLELWFVNRRAAFSAAHKLFGTCLDAPLTFVDYCMRLMHWLFDFGAEVCLTYLVTHMFADTIVGYVEEKERKFITPQEFFAEAIGIGLFTTGYVAMRRMDVVRWQYEDKPYSILLVEAQLERRCCTRQLLYFAKRHPGLFYFGHSAGHCLYNIAIVHGGISAVYYLSALGAGHQIGFKERIESQGAIFVFGSIPVGASLSLFVYLLKSQNRFILKTFNILLNSNARNNISHLAERIIAACPTVIVPAIFAAILAESYKYGKATTQDLILAGVTPPVLIGMNSVPLFIRKLLCYNKSDAFAKAIAVDNMVEFGGKRYYASEEALEIVTKILTGVKFPIYDNNSLKFSRMDRKVIALARQHVSSETREKSTELSLRERTNTGSYGSLWRGNDDVSDEENDAKMYPEEGISIQPKKRSCVLF